MTTRFVVTEITTRYVYAMDADEAADMARCDMGVVVSQDVHVEAMMEEQREEAQT